MDISDGLPHKCNKLQKFRSNYLKALKWSKFCKWTWGRFANCSSALMMLDSWYLTSGEGKKNSLIWLNSKCTHLWKADFPISLNINLVNFLFQFLLCHLQSAVLKTLILAKTFYIFKKINQKIVPVALLSELIIGFTSNSII